MLLVHLFLFFLFFIKQTKGLNFPKNNLSPFNNFLKTLRTPWDGKNEGEEVKTEASEGV